jgi:hypothetical protein
VEVPSRFELSDELWAEVEPLIPARPRRRRYPGRKAIDDRLVLNRILLHNRDRVSGPAARVRLRLRGDVLAAAADLAAGRRWEALHHKLLVKLNAAGKIDWSRADADSSHIRALLGAPDRAVPGRPCPRRLPSISWSMTAASRWRSP